MSSGTPPHIGPADVKAMFDGIDDATREIIVRRLRPQFSEAISAVNSTVGGTIAPPACDILAAFRECPIDIVRGVIIGQDPFPTAGNAHGLSFSVRHGVAIPPSTQNIYGCLRNRGLMADRPTHGNLTKWASQGVLLLNCALTTFVGKSNVHAAAWDTYTSALIQELSRLGRPLFFILLGAFAQKKEHLIGPGNKIIKWGHPSPVSTLNQKPGPANFVNSDVFEVANDFLVERGDEPIDWDISVDLPTGYVAPKPVAGGYERDVPADDDGFVDANAQNTSGENMAALMANVGKCLPATRWIPTRECGADDPQTPRPGLYLFTDGAATSNGRSGCRASWGFYVTDGSICAEVCGQVAHGDSPPSNNRGELEAIFRGMEFIRDHLDEFDCAEIIIISDSSYALGCVNSWIDAWIETPSKLAGKKNLDLIFAAREILTALEEVRTVTFGHTHSHCLEPSRTDRMAWFTWRLNDIADKLCAQALGSTDVPAKKNRACVAPTMYVRGRS